MAGYGPPPKDERSRLRDTPKREFVKADGKVGGFDLPDDVLPPIKIEGKVQFTPDGEIMREEWCQATVRWWNNWRESPQGIRMATAVDWDYLLDTALMHHQMWESGGKNSERAAEIRLRVATFGATPADRSRLKFEIEIPEEFSAGNSRANVSDMGAERMKRLANGGA